MHSYSFISCLDGATHGYQCKNLHQGYSTNWAVGTATTEGSLWAPNSTVLLKLNIVSASRGSCHVVLSCLLILLHCSENLSWDAHTQTPCPALLWNCSLLGEDFASARSSFLCGPRGPSSYCQMSWLHFISLVPAAHTLLWQRILGSVEQGHLPPPLLPLRHSLCSEWLPTIRLTTPRTLCSLLTSTDSW